MDFNFIKLMLLAMSFGIGVYLGKHVEPFLKWIKGGVEDGDGKLEAKELQMSFFTLLSGFIVITIGVFSVSYPDSVVYAVFTAATGMFLGKEYLKKNDNGSNKNNKS